jgi:hypothetical protein
MLARSRFSIRQSSRGVATLFASSSTTTRYLLHFRLLVHCKRGYSSLFSSRFPSSADGYPGDRKYNAATVPKSAAPAKPFQDLEVAVKRAVDQHLQKSHGDLFEISNLKELKQRANSKDLPTNIVGRLAKLNGYQKVETPGPDRFVRLAQGIIARPGYYSRLRQIDVKYTLYSQPIVSPKVPQKVPSIEVLPPLVEKDITAYRVLENSVEDVLTSIGDTIDRIILKPIRKIQRFMDGDKIKSENEPAEDGGSAFTNHEEENLLVCSNHSMAIVTDMKPKLRLLALPFELGHNAASTLISCSVVVCGAIPVTYRSMNFAMEYPGLAQLIKLSVVMTIIYGIWSSRSIYRTQQSQIVANGLGRRVYARDDAVLLVLQEGAKQKVAERVLGIYHRIRRKTESQDYKSVAALEMDEISSLEIAKGLGIIVKSENGGYEALPIKTAVSLLTELR